jgi:hypothetical protein
MEFGDKTAGGIGKELVNKPRLKLFGMSIRQYRQNVAPGQYFVTCRAAESERTAEAFALWYEKCRVYPAIMKNPCRHHLGSRMVEPDEVEFLGLKRFTLKVLKRMGWKWLPLLELDLANSPTVCSIMAVEQRCHLHTHDLELGTQRNNRVLGAGNWDKVEPSQTLAMVGFAYAPPGWLEKYQGGDRIAIVREYWSLFHTKRVRTWSTAKVQQSRGSFEIPCIF